MSSLSLLRALQIQSKVNSISFGRFSGLPKSGFSSKPSSSSGSSSSSGKSVSKDTAKFSQSKEAKEPVSTEEDKAVAKTSSLEHWKKQLSVLASKEINEIKGQIESQFGSPNNHTPQWLSKSGFAIKRLNDGTIQLLKETKGFNVTISFDPMFQEENQNEYDDTNVPEAGEGKSDSESSSESSSENEDNQDEADQAEKPNTQSVPFGVDLAILGKEGEAKGTVTFVGEVGADCRVYINTVQAIQGAQPVRTNKLDIEDFVHPSAEFDRLSQDVQDRMYDLLDEIGVDDKMGSYIRYFVDTYETTNTVSVLDNLQKIFSS